MEVMGHGYTKKTQREDEHAFARETWTNLFSPTKENLDDFVNFTVPKHQVYILYRVNMFLRIDRDFDRIVKITIVSEFDKDASLMAHLENCRSFEERTLKLL